VTEPEQRFDGVHCAIIIRRPAPGVLVLAITGTDTGELGDAPFRAVADDLARAPIELFIDARATRGASMHVSRDWAVWLGNHRDCFRAISMLTASRFVQLTADFVRTFAQLGELMRVYTDAAAFDAALSVAVADATASSD
jgi:hypothetical protein